MERTPAKIMELFRTNNSEEIKKFFHWYEKEIDQVCIEISECFKYEKEYEILDITNIQVKHLIRLTMQTIDSLITAFSLFVIGYHVPSNHMIRQSFESMFQSILISTHRKLNIDKKIGYVVYYESYHDKQSFARGHKALSILMRNLDRLKIKKEEFDNISCIYKHYHNYSHPSDYTMLTRFDFNNALECWGANHDPEHKELYEREFETRIGLLKRFRIITQTNLFRITSGA